MYFCNGQVILYGCWTPFPQALTIARCFFLSKINLGINPFCLSKHEDFMFVVWKGRAQQGPKGGDEWTNDYLRPANLEDSKYYYLSLMKIKERWNKMTSYKLTIQQPVN